MFVLLELWKWLSNFERPVCHNDFTLAYEDRHVATIWAGRDVDKVMLLLYFGNMFCWISFSKMLITRSKLWSLIDHVRVVNFRQTLKYLPESEQT